MSNQAKELLEEYASIRTMEQIIDIAINMPPELIPERTGRWKPEMDEPYFCVGDECVFSSEWRNDRIDIRRFNDRNCFQTQKEAEKEDERKTNIAEMRNWLEEKNDGWEPDWNEKTEKHGIGFNLCDGTRELMVDTFIKSKPNWKYGETQEIMTAMLNTFGEEKIKQFIEA